MSRYRKVDVRIWGDEEFRKLSRPSANGQDLFTYCLIGPFTTNIPGLFSVGEAAMAERLGWPLHDFREAFKEVARKPLVKADWSAPLVFVPNAIRYNIPQNVNVIKGWAALWDELPECALKEEAYQTFKSFLESLPISLKRATKNDAKVSLLQALIGVARNDSPNDSRNGIRNQDQDSGLRTQEQERGEGKEGIAGGKGREFDAEADMDTDAAQYAPPARGAAVTIADMLKRYRQEPVDEENS